MRLAACCSATRRMEIELGDVAECSTRLGLMSCNCASGLVGFVLQTRGLPEEIPLQVGADWIACPFCLGALAERSKCHTAVLSLLTLP